MPWRRSKQVAVLAGAVILGLAAIEGLVSLALFAYDLGASSQPPVAER